MNLKALFARLVAPLHRQRVEEDFAEEVQSHLDMAADEYVRRGMDPAQARLAARVSFGGVTRVREEYRAQSSLPVAEALFRDARLAVRSLVRAPSFALAVISTLGLGIAANTAVFCLIDAVLLRPLPFQEPERLFMVWEEAPKLGYARYDGAPANFVDWRSEAVTFEGLAAYHGDAVNLVEGDSPERLDIVRIAPNLFSLLGVSPALGRDFLESEAPVRESRVAILSDSLWRRRFGGKMDVLGDTIMLDGAPHTVVGIMPEGFHFPSVETQLWTPVSFPIRPGDLQRNMHFLRVIGRLSDESSPEQAQQELSAIAARLALAYPDTNKDHGVLIAPLQDALVGDVAQSYWFLLCASGLLLAIALGNVASMLIARQIDRRRDLSARIALGASPTHLARQLVMEGSVLIVGSLALGLACSAAATRLLVPLIPPTLMRTIDVSLDFRALLYVALLASLFCLLFCLLPLRHALRLNIAEQLRSRSAIADRSMGSRPTLVAIQVALAVVVVACTTLLARTMFNLTQVDPGFRAKGVVTARLELSAEKYSTADDRIALYDRVLREIEAVPGVQSAGLTTFLPYTNFSGLRGFWIEGQPDLADEPKQAWLREISHRYLATMGIPLLAGRWFDDRDTTDAPPVVLINEQAAKLFDGSPIGKRLRISKEPWLTVVGVVGDVREEGLDTSPQRPTVYTPHTQIQRVWFFNPRDLAVRANVDPAVVITAIQRAVHLVDPEQPVSYLRPMEAIVARETAYLRSQLQLLGAFSGLALALASAGIFAVLSYLVAARTQEIAVRRALGAQTGRLLFCVIGGGLRWVAVGAGAGLLLALLAARALQGLLFGVTPADPVSLVGGAVALFAVAVAAGLVPAWRASRIDPMVALRLE